MSNIANREILPLPLRGEATTAAIVGALRGMGERALEVTESVTAQLSPSTATWGLPAWEEITGLYPNAGTSLEERRANVLAQLCTRGTTNAEAIERLVRTLTGYGCSVTENYTDYSFSLQFLGEADGFVTIDLTLTYASVEKIKPAHLKFNVRYTDWESLSTLTWEQLEAMNWTWAELEAAVPLKKQT